MQSKIVISMILRVALAFAFIFPAVNALFDPSAWIGYFPPFVHGIVPDEVLLHAFGAIEVIFALWVLSGWKIAFPALTMAAMLVAIVAFNPSQFQILFRDLSIAVAAVALALMQGPPRSKKGIQINLDA